MKIENHDGEVLDFDDWVSATRSNLAIIEHNLKSDWPNALVGFVMAAEMMADVKDVGSQIDRLEHYHSDWDNWTAIQFVRLLESVLQTAELAWPARRNTNVDGPFRESLKRIVYLRLALQRKMDDYALSNLHRKLEGRFENISFNKP